MKQRKFLLQWLKVKEKVIVNLWQQMHITDQKIHLILIKKT